MAVINGHLDYIKFITTDPRFLQPSSEDYSSFRFLTPRFFHPSWNRNPEDFLKVFKNFIACLQHLKVDLNLVDFAGVTPLMWATVFNHPDCVDFLLRQIGVDSEVGVSETENGCESPFKDSDFQTKVTSVCDMGIPSSNRALRSLDLSELGLTRQAESKLQKTPLKYAKEHGFSDIAKKIESFQDDCKSYLALKEVLLTSVINVVTLHPLILEYVLYPVPDFVKQMKLKNTNAPNNDNQQPQTQSPPPRGKKKRTRENFFKESIPQDNLDAGVGLIISSDNSDVITPYDFDGPFERIPCIF